MMKTTTPTTIRMASSARIPRLLSTTLPPDPRAELSQFEGHQSSGLQHVEPPSNRHGQARRQTSSHRARDRRQARGIRLAEDVVRRERHLRLIDDALLV